MPSYMVIIRKTLLLVLLLQFFISGSMTYGASTDVYFAGVAFTGNAEDLSKVLQYTSEALSNEGQSQLNQKLYSSLLENPPESIKLVFDQLANLDDGSSALVLAATIDRETVIVEQIGSEFKLLVELAGQALFFDFKERQILYSYPVTVQNIDVMSLRPVSEDIQRVVEGMLFGSGEDSFADNFIMKLENVILPDAAARRFRVASVEAGESVKSKHAMLITSLFDTGIIGHEFSKTLSDKLNLPILPYQSGQALGGAMAARFANGDIYNLIIPDPDYEIHVHLEDFRGRILNETASFRQELMGAFFRIDVIEPLSGRIFFSHNLRQGATKTIPATQKDFDAGKAYYETFLVGLSEFTTSITQGNEEWVSQQSEVRDLRRQLASLEDLVRVSR